MIFHSLFFVRYCERLSYVISYSVKDCPIGFGDNTDLLWWNDVNN